MAIETKTIRAYSYSSYDGTKEDYLNFGWQHTEDTRVRSGRGHRTEHVLARDKNMPHYYEIVKLENEYFALKRQKTTYKPITFGYLALTFVLFIIPCVIYVYVKTKQKKKIAAHNAELQRQMDEIVYKAKQLRKS